MQPLLEGVRVLSLEHFGAGPYGTQLLADLGADVIKVENPRTGGDISRSVGPYLLGDDDSLYYQSFNRGKRSVLIDLTSADGRARFERLVEGADAVVNNLRGDQPEKLRIRYADLAEVKPAIVCAHISAYGRGNSRENWPGYDYLMQAECGFLDLTGEPDGLPARFGLSMVDFMSGTLMACALLAAVMRARETGEGAEIDTCLYDTALHQLTYPAIWFLNEGHQTRRLPRSSHPSAAPSQLFRTADGWMFVMCQAPRFWEAFCKLAGREDLLRDARFRDAADRVAHRETLTEEVEKTLLTAPTAHWMELLSGTVPVAPVHDVASALTNPFAREAGMLNVVDHPHAEGGLAMLSSPIRVNGRRGPDRRAPLLGEHDAELP